MGQYTIKDVQNRAELLKEATDNIFRAIYTRTGESPETLDQVPGSIMSIPQPPTPEPLTITPSADGQEFYTSDEKKYNPITVEPVTSAIDSNIQPENIKAGISILGVTGALPGGNAKLEESFDVQPTTSDQAITPREGYVFSGGTVHAVTAAIDKNIQSENIKEGVSILGVAGFLKGEKPEESFNVQPTTSDQIITPTAGSVFRRGTVRAVTSAIDSNIQPENIKEGVSILGVAGTLSGGSGGDTPDYRYMKGTIDRAGLRAIGWTDEDILTFEQNKTPHYSWQNDQYKVSDENKALYLLDDPKPSSYKNNPNVTFVPKKNMGSHFAEYQGFYGMRYIKGIPFYDTSNVTNMNTMFYNCTNLITIPLLDVSNVRDTQQMFSGCTDLVAIPQLNTSKVTKMYAMFKECSSLTAIPQLNTSNVTNMSNMFQRCSSLTAIPQLNTSNVTGMVAMFEECKKLTTIPQLDTSKVTNMSDMFRGCSRLTAIPQLDTSNVGAMFNMFAGCNSLTTIPQLDTSKVTNMGSMFSDCSSLTAIPQLDTSNVTSMDYMFNSCDILTTVEGIDFSGLTSSPSYLLGFSSPMPNITRFIVNGKINVSFSDNYSIKALTAIDYESVKSILTAAANKDNNNSRTLAFNRTMTDQNGELAALVTQCAAKGWTITGLTLQ